MYEPLSRFVYDNCPYFGNTTLVFLFQEPRIGGRKYQDELVATLRSEKTQLESLTIELFQPADQDYLRELSSLGVHVTLTMSPESGSEGTRSAHGWDYSNEAIIRTIEDCQKLGMHLMVFFMVGLANETPATMEDTWKLWERIYAVSEEARTALQEPTAIHSFGPMVLLDPGSLAFDFPEKYGYKLISKSLEDYVRAMDLPSWHQWMSYETNVMDRASITNLILDSIEHSIEVWEKHEVYSRLQAAGERLRHVDANRWIIEQVDRAMQQPSEADKQARLESLRKALDKYKA